MKETAGIYKLTSPNGKVYIGQSYNLCKRFSRYKKLHCKSQPKLYNALVKYGWENFKKEILFEIDKTNVNFIDILNKLESFYIEKYKCVENGYNCMTGGYNSTHSEESRKKISESLKGIQSGINHPNFGKKISEEIRKKISESLKGENHPNFGKHLSEETRKRISIKQIGEKSHMFGKTSWNKGIPQTEEAKKKSSESHKGKTPWNKGIPQTKEVKKKLSEKNPSAKKINKYDLDGNYIESYISIADAAVKNNGHASLICSVLSGKQNKTAGYKWKYFDDNPIENPIYN